MAHKKLSFLVSVAALNGVTEAEKYREIDQIFAYFDLDQDSEVTFSELGAGFSSFDKDEDGLISETELLKLPAARLKSLCTDTRFKRYFNRQNNVQQTSSLFASFDRNDDGRITQREWLQFFFAIASNSNLNSNQLTKWFTENASKVCGSDAPEFSMDQIGGLAKPFKDIYYKFDQNRNGVIEPKEIFQLFKTFDILKDQHWSKKEFNKALDTNLLEYCYESKKVWPSENCNDSPTCQLKQSLLNKVPLTRAVLQEQTYLGGPRKLQSINDWCQDSWRDVTWVSRDMKASTIAANGNQVYIISKKEVRKGGYQIYKREGEEWIPVSAWGFMKLAVGTDGSLWAVNNRKKLFKSVDGGAKWSFIQNKVIDVATGADGSMFVMGGRKVNFGYSLKQYLPQPRGKTAWKLFPGSVRNIAVDPRGAPWVVSARRTVLSWNGNSWTNHKVRATKIAVGGDNSVFIIRRGSILKFEPNSNNWMKIPGQAKEIAVNGSGKPLIIDRRNGVKWPEENCKVKVPLEKRERKEVQNQKVGENLKVKEVKGASTEQIVTDENDSQCKLKWQKLFPRPALHIAATSPSTLYIISSKATLGGNLIHKNHNGLWSTENTGAKKIAVGKKAWIIDDENNVFYKEGLKWVQVGGKAVDIAANGDSVFVLSVSQMPGGREVLKFARGQWQSYARGAIDIAVDPQGNLWYITDTYEVFRQVGDKFVNLDVQMLQISISPSGQVFGVNLTHQIVQLVGQAWKPLKMTGKQVAAGVRPYVISKDGFVFQQTKSCFEKRDAPIAKEKVEEMEKIALKKVEGPKELEKKVVKVVKTVEQKEVKVVKIVEQKEAEVPLTVEQNQDKIPETLVKPIQQEVKSRVENPIFLGAYTRAPFQYLVRGDQQDNKVAEAECQHWGGSQLLNIADKKEADFVGSIFPGKVHWIGLRQIKGQFVWTNGETSTFSNWQLETPTILPGFGCTAVWPSRKWDHISCQQLLPFICKRPVTTLEPYIVQQINDRKNGYNRIVNKRPKKSLLKKIREQRNQEKEPRKKQISQQNKESQQKREQETKNSEELLKVQELQQKTLEAEQKQKLQEVEQEQKLQELEQQKLQEIEQQKLKEAEQQKLMEEQQKQKLKEQEKKRQEVEQEQKLEDEELKRQKVTQEQKLQDKQQEPKEAEQKLKEAEQRPIEVPEQDSTESEIEIARKMQEMLKKQAQQSESSRKKNKALMDKLDSEKERNRQLEKWVSLARQIQQKILEKKQSSQVKSFKLLDIERKTREKLLKEVSSKEQIRSFELMEAKLQKIKVKKMHHKSEKTNQSQLQKAKSEHKALVQRLKETQNRLKFVNSEQKRQEEEQKKSKTLSETKLLKMTEATQEKQDTWQKKHQKHQQQFKQLLKLTNNRQKKFEQKLQKEIEARLIRQKTEAKKQHEAAGLKWYKTQKKQIITEVLAQSRLHKIKDMQKERIDQLNHRNVLIDKLTQQSKKELGLTKQKIETLKMQLKEESTRNEQQLIQERKKFNALKNKEQFQKIQEMKKDHTEKLKERNVFIDKMLAQREKEQLTSQEKIKALKEMLDRERLINKQEREKAKALMIEQEKRKARKAQELKDQLQREKQMERAKILMEKIEREKAAGLKAKAEAEALELETSRWEKAQAIQAGQKWEKAQALKAIVKERNKQTEAIIAKQLQVEAEVSQVKEQLREAEALILLIKREKAEVAQVKKQLQQEERMKTDLKEKASTVTALWTKEQLEEEEYTIESIEKDRQTISQRQKLQQLIKARASKSPTPPSNLFQMLDRNQDNKLKIFELYTILTNADHNHDQVVSQLELLTWLVQNEENMCRPYQSMINQLMQIRP